MAEISQLNARLMRVCFWPDADFDIVFSFNELQCLVRSSTAIVYEIRFPSR